ncbi:MAG TPA: hypothetical protein VGG71_11565, partial [Chitinophagaceae bacterium]
SVVAAFIFQSCTSKEISRPVNATNSAQQNAVTAATLKNPSAGSYSVQLYVENGDTSTAEFKNYVFTFKANGVLIANVDIRTFTGKWESGNNGSQLKLDIKGTAALNDVNKNWDVVQITSAQISLKDNQGKFGDKLVFAKN